MHCSACTGAFHPATGHQWSERTRLCLSCAREFIVWLKQRQHRRARGGFKLYDYTETSRKKRA